MHAFKHPMQDPRGFLKTGEVGLALDRMDGADALERAIGADDNVNRPGIPGDSIS